MALRWLAVNTVDGSVICRLPSVAVTGPLRRTIGRYETATARLTVTDSTSLTPTSPSWPATVQPYQAMWVAYDGPPGGEWAIWGGVVTSSTRNLGNTVDVSLATPEVYLDRRYVGFYDATGRDSCLIVTDLVSQFCGAASSLPGSFGLPLTSRSIAARPSSTGTTRHSRIRRSTRLSVTSAPSRAVRSGW